MDAVSCVDSVVVVVTDATEEVTDKVAEVAADTFAVAFMDAVTDAVADVVTVTDAVIVSATVAGSRAFMMEPFMVDVIAVSVTMYSSVTVINALVCDTEIVAVTVTNGTILVVIVTDAVTDDKAGSESVPVTAVTLA